MKKLALLIAFMATLAAAVPASGAVLHANNCTSGCSDFQANGKGWLSVVGNGAEWGSINSGTIWVRDRTGNTDPNSKKNPWVFGRGLTWKSIGDHGWKVTSRYPMSFSASTKSFWVKLQGPGIQACGVFDGSGQIAGTGTYSVKGHKHTWPTQATELHF
jgi:hypothetical protein